MTRMYANEVSRVSLYVAAGAVLQVAESLIPYPLPGVRVGLANIVTLVVLARLGVAEAVRVSLLRTLIGSLVLGTFLSPSFVLSFSGALAGTLVMAGVFQLSRATPVRLSLVGISVAGSVCHIGAQVAVVYLLFIRSAAVLAIWPWLGLVAIGTGLFTGYAALRACRRLESGGRANEAVSAGSRAGVSMSRPAVSSSGFSVGERQVPFARIPARVKFAAALGVAGCVVLFQDWRVYCVLFVALALVAVIGRVSAAGLAKDLGRLTLFLVLAFVSPALFSGIGRVLFVLGPLRVTSEGLAQGGLFVGRVLVLFLSSAIFMRTTPATEVARAVAAVLFPLRALGVSPERMAAITSLSWASFPVLWDHARRVVFTRKGNRAHLWEEMTVEVYRKAEEL